MRQDIREIRKNKDDGAKRKIELKWKRIALGITVIGLISSNVWTCLELQNSKRSKVTTISKSPLVDDDTTQIKK